MNKILSLVSGVLIACTASAALAEQSEKDLSKIYLQKSEIEGIVKEYLLENGDLVIQAIEAYQVKQEQEATKAAQEAIKQNESYLYGGKSPEAGNPNASVTIVEFFDYNCGYCKKALDDIVALLDEDDDLRVVFKEVPILSPSSREVAAWALASNKQGKYFDYHRELMAHRGQMNEASLEKMAKKVGLDVEQLKKDKDAQEVQSMINDNLAYMEKFGIRGTPSFIVGDQLLKGFVGKDAIKQIISDMRDKNS